jgi:hypothetical protein
MGKRSRRRAGARIEDVLGELASRTERPPGRSGDPAGELAESFRRARKALEAATRDVVALRHRVTKPPS